MPQDYARKSAARPRPKTPARPSSIPVFFAGVVTGALVAFVVPALFGGGSGQQTISEQRKEAMAEPKKGIKFDFYTLLKDTEIMVPDGPALEPRSEEPAQENYNYLLQVGSFRNSRDADGLRAKLIMLNLDAKVEAVGQGAGDTWHRVIVGPFASASSMSAARNRLAQNDIDSLLIKRKR